MTDSLSVSPDIQAFYCYAVVFFAGLIVAWVRLRRFFEGKPGAWGIVSSWGLFASYSLIPVALFWFLDRTGSIHDTSLFAAILIGFGYQQVLTGTAAAARIPGDLGKWWQPFQSWANWTSNRILDRIKLRSDRFNALVIREIRNDSQSQLPKLKLLAYNNVADPAALQTQVDALDTPQNQALLGAAGVLEKQVTLLYRAIRDVRDGDYLLFRGGVISRLQYFWYVREGRSVLRAVFAGVLVLVGLTWIALNLQNSLATSRYYLWRLTKTNSTETDQIRAKAHLIDHICELPAANLRLLTEALQHDNLRVETADRLLAIIVETRSKLPPSALLSQLTASLRSEDPDVRARVQSTLLYLARDGGFCAPSAALKEWKPSKSDSSVYIDEQIENWTREWKSPPGQKACDSAASHP
jgi:hypothetical protein